MRRFAGAATIVVTLATTEAKAHTFESVRATVSADDDLSIAQVRAQIVVRTDLPIAVADTSFIVENEVTDVEARTGERTISGRHIRNGGEWDVTVSLPVPDGARITEALRRTASIDLDLTLSARRRLSTTTAVLRWRNADSFPVEQIEYRSVAPLRLADANCATSATESLCRPVYWSDITLYATNPQLRRDLAWVAFSLASIIAFVASNARRRTRELRQAAANLDSDLAEGERRAVVLRAQKHAALALLPLALTLALTEAFGTPLSLFSSTIPPTAAGIFLAARLEREQGFSPLVIALGALPFATVLLIDSRPLRNLITVLALFALPVAYFALRGSGSRGDAP